MSEIYEFSLGDFTCITLNEGQGTNKASTFFANAPAEELVTALKTYNLDAEAVPSWYNPLFVNTGEYKVIVDTGSGRGDMAENLQRAGLSSADIDVVIITHAHGDHIGGNTDDDGKPTFQNARYVIWRGEWDYWTSEDNLRTKFEQRAPFIRKNLLGIKERFEFMESETDIVPGIQAIHAPGHTPGHMALLIQSKGQQMLHIVDTLHQRIQTEHPDWSPTFDSLPDISPITRRNLLKRIANENLLMFSFHLPFPGLGRLTPKGDGWVWNPV